MFGMGGMGMGMGGSPLMTGLFAGGLGYLLGSNNNQQMAPQVQQVAAAPAPAPAPQAAPASPSNSASEKLALLKQLGELHDSGVLSDDEFAREKKRLLDS